MADTHGMWLRQAELTLPFTPGFGKYRPYRRLKRNGEQQREHPHHILKSSTALR